MDLRDIDRAECEELGLIQSDDDVPEPQDRGFNEDLQATPEVEADDLAAVLQFLLRDIAHVGTDGVLRFIGAGGVA
jgi:hypothetical protein